MLVDMTHVQSLKVFNRQPVPFTSLPTLKSFSNAALAVLNFTNTLGIMGRDLKAFCGNSSGDFFEVDIFVVFDLQSLHVNT